MKNFINQFIRILLCSSLLSFLFVPAMAQANDVPARVAVSLKGDNGTGIGCYSVWTLKNVSSKRVTVTVKINYPRINTSTGSRSQQPKTLVLHLGANSTRPVETRRFNCHTQPSSARIVSAHYS